MTENRIIPFNPLDKRNLGESVGQALLNRPIFSLSNIEPFSGAGIYVIYYCGDFYAYREISKANLNNNYNAPIYIGKAIPKGGRKGGNLEAPPGNVLYNRLIQHIRSIEAASNLSICDFHCRFLTVDDIWIPLGETLLIAKFNPLWNHIIDGFGNHDPGKGRREGMRPRWDVIHPGRAWAEQLKQRNETADQIAMEAKEYLQNNPPM